MPRSLVAFWAFHIAGAAEVEGPENAAIGRNIAVFALGALIEAGDLLYSGGVEHAGQERNKADKNKDDFLPICHWNESRKEDERKEDGYGGDTDKDF